MLANAVCQSTSMYLVYRIREQARSHRWSLGSDIEHKQKRPDHHRSGRFCISVAAGQAAIDTLSLFIALFSSWRIRSADTLYFCARSCSVAFSSANQRW